MKKQTMPIAQKVLRGTVGFTMPYANDELLESVRESAHAIRSAVHLDANIASALYWQGEKQLYEIGKDFGPLILPFDCMWMEWSIPAVVNMEGSEYRLPAKVSEGALLEQTQLEDGNRMIVAQLFMNGPDDLITAWPWVFIKTSREGRYLEHNMAIPEGGPAEELHQIASELNVAYMAINLMNCKNVELSDGGTVPVRRSGRKKKRVPKLTFKTIVLPGMSGTSKPGNGDSDVMSRHRVRGHFKTFTKDNPLFGRLTGTYWWGWQVRGNAKNGITVSDYSLDGFEAAS